MAIDRLDIVIQGSGPYGFRLAGGDGRPLTVTKVICIFISSSLHDVVAFGQTKMSGPRNLLSRKAANDL